VARPTRKEKEMGLLNMFGRKKQYEPDETYLRLRNQIFSVNRDQIHSLLPPASPLLAVLMESGYEEALITLLTAANGTVSLYFSNGGGMIGLGQYESVRTTALDFLSLASQFISKAAPAKDHALPSRGYTTFYFLTTSGVFFATAKEKDFENKRHPLFLKAHEVISQARRVDEERKRDLHEFMHAVTTGNEAKVSELLQTLPTPDIADPTGLTPLMAAAHSGYGEIVKKLLDRKATIDKKDSEGYTALMFACNAGQFNCVQVLLDNGANANETDNENSTPIMFAAQHGYNDIVRYLLRKGANPLFVGNHGLSAIGFAKQNHFVETEQILLGRK
jgi:hypothetical protein